MPSCRTEMTVLVQEVWEERVWAARPMRLVAKTEDGAVLWFPRGTGYRAPTTPERSLTLPATSYARTL